MFSSFRLNTISMGAAAGATDTYWITTLTGSTAYCVTLDATGNIYFGGASTVSTSSVGTVVKLPSDASSITWQRYTKTTNASGFVVGVAVDASNNVFAVSDTFNGGGGVELSLMTKWNSAGTLQWVNDRCESSLNISNIIPKYMTIDSSGNPYVVGYLQPNSSVYTLFTSKWTTAGALTTGARLQSTASNFAGIALDTSSNCYSVGAQSTTGQTAGLTDIYLAKYNSAMTLQWQVTYGNAFNNNGTKVTTDSAGNIYICGHIMTATTGYYRLYVAKITPASGVISWQRLLDDTVGAVNITSSGIAVDSLGNVYVTGTSASGKGVVAKYNSSGTIQWQRTLANSGGNVSFVDLKLISDSSILISANMNNGILVKLPTDGTKTGTYSTYTYAASTYTDSAGSFTQTSRTATSGTSTVVNYGETNSNGTTTVTRSQISLP